MTDKPDRGHIVGQRWLRDEQPSGSTSKTVKLQERRAAKLISSDGGARRRSGSGANPLAKGDAVSWKRLGECKQTVNKEFRLRAQVLAKIEEEARSGGLMPFLHIEFLSKGRTRFTRDMSTNWVIIPDWAFRDLVNAANDKGDDQ